MSKRHHHASPTLGLTGVELVEAIRREARANAEQAARELARHFTGFALACCGGPRPA